MIGGSPALLIQGRLNDATDTPYPNLPWKLGLIKRNTTGNTGGK